MYLCMWRMLMCVCEGCHVPLQPPSLKIEMTAQLLYFININQLNSAVLAYNAYNIFRTVETGIEGKVNGSNFGQSVII